MVDEIIRIGLHFVCMAFSFYALSGLDLSKIMLNRPNRGMKGQALLVLMSMALGFLAAQFILAIQYQIS